MDELSKEMTKLHMPEFSMAKSSMIEHHIAWRLMHPPSHIAKYPKSFLEVSHIYHQMLD